MKNKVPKNQAAAESPRAGWKKAAKEVAAMGEDALIWPEFPNTDDESLQW